MATINLGSSMAQQTERDEWIGWDSDTFIKTLADRPTARWCRWVHDSVDRLQKSIYQKDFLKESLIEQRDLKRPTEDAIGRLVKEAARAAAWSSSAF